MKHRTKVHQYNHLVRLARRRALAGSETAYRRYAWLIDKGCRLVPAENFGPRERHHGQSRIYKMLKEMGWKDVKV